jgi:glycine cleavage system H protein
MNETPIHGSIFSIRPTCGMECDRRCCKVRIHFTEESETTMTTVPEDLRYTDEHIWVRGTGPIVEIGITDFAQDSLGDIVSVLLPEVDTNVTAGSPCGEVESTKSVSDLYAPLDGTVTEVNTALDANPELVNTSPYVDGWLYKIALAPVVSVDGLLKADEYRTVTQG